MNLISIALRILKRRPAPAQPVDTPLQAAMKEADALIRDAHEKARYNYGIDRARLAEACMSAMHLINAEIEIIERIKANGGEDFSREYTAWHGEPPANDTPRVIPEAVAKANRYRLAGAASAVLEIALATFVLSGMGAGLFTAFISSAVLTWLLLLLAHGAIAEATERPSPHHSRDLIKKYVFRPALFLTIPAIGIVLLARVVSDLSDWLLPIFLPLLQLSLWIATLGLILLGGALYALADLYRWSERHAKNFDQLDRLRAYLENKRAYYHSFIPRAGTEDGPPRPARRAGRESQAAWRVVASILLAVTGFLAGCEGRAVEEGGKEAAGAAGPGTPAELHFEIDVSGSVEERAGESAARNLAAQLPGMIEASGAQIVTVKHNGEDGWSALAVLSVRLPEREQPEVKAGLMKAGEAAGLTGINGSVKEHNRRRQEEANRKLDEKHKAEFNKALGEITPAMLTPKAGASARCTDLYGVLSRIALGRGGARKIYVIVTDGYHTCGRMRAVAAPQGDVKALVFLTPAGGREAGGKRGPEQFAGRSEALMKAAPWLIVIPAFESNLADYIREAKGEKPGASIRK